MELDAARARQRRFSGQGQGASGFLGGLVWILRGLGARLDWQPTTGANPDPVSGTRRGWRPLPGEALRGRRRDRVGRHLPRRPRHPAGGGALPRAGRPPLARSADAAGRRRARRGALGGRAGGGPPGALAVHDRGLERRVRHLARRAGAQDRGRPARPGGRALRGPRDRAGRARARRARSRTGRCSSTRWPRSRIRRSRRRRSTTWRSGPSCSRPSSGTWSATAPRP